MSTTLSGFTRVAAAIAMVVGLASCGAGSSSTPTCAADDLDCFMSHLVVQDSAGNQVQVTFVGAATVSALTAATSASATAPQLTSRPASLSYAYGTVIEGVDISLTDALQLGFTDPNGCEPIVALTLSKNGKSSSHTGCFPGLHDHRTSGAFTRSVGFSASAPDGATFDLDMVPVSSTDCSSIDNPSGLLSVSGTYVPAAVAGRKVSIPVTIAPPAPPTSSGTTYYYASWNCNNVSGCIAGMGYNTGSAGPFCTAQACAAWVNTYIKSATCGTQASYPIYNAPPAGTCQN